MSKSKQVARSRAALIAQQRRGRFLDFFHFTQRTIRLEHKPFVFAGRPYLRAIYDTSAQRLVLRASRQVEKSTLLSNRIVYDALRYPGIKILLCSPRIDQAFTFSRERLHPIVQQSPILRRLLWPNARPMPMNNIQFRNGSKLSVRAAFRNADSARGISVDVLVIDEYQDLAPGALHVLQETLSHSTHRRLILAGTPKWSDNHLETAFQQSTACEWHVPCPQCQCDKLLDERTLGPVSLLCPQCQARLDPASGHWVARNPQSTWGEGFTVSHLMVPWVRVPEIHERQAVYDRVTFLNEVLGLPATLGDHVITREEIEACCDDRPAAQSPEEVPLIFRRQLVLGVDWGGGSKSGTVAVVGYAHGDHNFSIVRMDRWRPHEDPNQVLRRVFGICQRFRINTVAADDNGNGTTYNRLLFMLLRDDGQAPRMWGILYGPDTMPPQPHGALTRWMIGRTPSIGGLFTRIKSGWIRFPRVADSGSFLDEFVSVVAEYNDDMRIVKYMKPDDRRDDALHATNYAEMVAMRLLAAQWR